MRVLPPCAQVSIACARHLCLPTRVLARLGELFQAAWQVPTHVGRIARGPSPVDAGPTGRGLPGRREASRVSALTTRRFRRRQALRRHEWSGGLAAGPVAECGDGGDRHGQRHATAGLERVNHGQAPGCDCAWSAWSSRRRRAVGAKTARAEDWQTMGGAGVGPATALRQRRCAGPQVARPVERRAGRRRIAFRRNWAVVGAWSVASRARLRSRMAASATAGTSTGVRAPERSSRASWTASRQSGFTRSPACWGRRAARRPSRPGLGSADRESASLHRGPLQSCRPGVGLCPAAGARVDHCRRAEGQWSPGR